MRELERHPYPTSAHPTRRPERMAIIGRGRAGTVLASAFRAAGMTITGPLGRGAAAHDADTVLLCVPDAEIASAAAAVEIGPPVGHCSGATGLDVLAPHAAFSLHPLMTFAGAGAPPRLAGAGAAIAGSAPHTRALARALADALGMHPIEVAAENRAAYHAAASIASNFLITLEAAAERLAATAGVERRCCSRSCGRRSRTGERWGPSVPLPARWPVATSRRSSASAQPSPSAPPSSWPCSTAWCWPPDRWPTLAAVTA